MGFTIVTKGWQPNSRWLNASTAAGPVCGELLILPEPSIFATAASIPPLGLTHPVCGQYLRFAFWKSVQPTACFVRLASKGPEPA